MLIIKKLTQQCAPCSRASIMILQNGIAISLEGRHLVLTLLAGIQFIYRFLSSWWKQERDLAFTYSKNVRELRRISYRVISRRIFYHFNFDISVSLSISRVFSSVFFLFCFFFYQGFLSRTLTTHRTAGEGRGPSYSTLPPAREHSDIYLQLCTWDDYHIFLIATLVFTRLQLDESYHLIELLFDWLMT